MGAWSSPPPSRRSTPTWPTSRATASGRRPWSGSNSYAPGDATGVGARYLTTERQAMQADRRPYAPLRRGMVVKTLCEIRELTPQRRIAWHAHTVPRALGLSADLAFELSREPDGGTRLTQHYIFHQPTLMRWMFRLLYGPDVDRKGHAQWGASLQNIKTILEASAATETGTQLVGTTTHGANAVAS